MSISTRTYYTETRTNKLMSLLTIRIHIGLCSIQYKPSIAWKSSRGFGQAYQSLTILDQVLPCLSLTKFDHFCPHLPKSDQDFPNVWANLVRSQVPQPTCFWKQKEASDWATFVSDDSDCSGSSLSLSLSLSLTMFDHTWPYLTILDPVLPCLTNLTIRDLSCLRGSLSQTGSKLKTEQDFLFTDTCSKALKLDVTSPLHILQWSIIESDYKAKWGQLYDKKKERLQNP